MRMQYSQHRHAGFTLVELSIVLIIIGLITGGILLGRDLILSAGIRAQIAQIEKLDVAVNNFRQKYNCLPGDCGHAVELGWGTFNGDDDGLIIGHSAPMYGLEPSHFWWELALAKMIEDGSEEYGGYPGVNSPANKLPGTGVRTTSFYTGLTSGFWIASHTALANLNFPAGNYWLITTYAFNLSGGDLPTGVFLPGETYRIDVKIDDGLPMEGKMQVVSGIDASQQIYRATTSMTGENDTCIDDYPPNNAQAVYNKTIIERTETSLCVPVIAVSW